MKVRQLRFYANLGVGKIWYIFSCRTEFAAALEKTFWEGVLVRVIAKFLGTETLKNSASTDLVSSMLSAYAEHAQSMRRAYTEQAQSNCRELQINQLSPTAKADEFSVLFNFRNVIGQILIALFFPKMCSFCLLCKIGQHLFKCSESNTYIQWNSPLFQEFYVLF